MATVERDPRGDIEWAQQRIKRLRKMTSFDMPLVLEASNLTLKIDLSDWPLPARNDSQQTPGHEPPESSLASQIMFVDSARDAGIAFSYHNGADPTRAYMFEFGGEHGRLHGN